MTILFLIITIVMWGLVGYAFYRRRGSLAEHEPISVTGGQAWIAIGGIAVPLLVLGVLFVLGLQLLRDFPIHGMHGAGKHSQMQQTMKPEIRIIGHQWWWEIQYLNDEPSKQFTTANELHLPVGRTMNIEVETRDVMHSFWVPALHGKVDVIPGQPNYIRLEASQAGEYEGQCAEFCGEEHSRMRLWLSHSHRSTIRHGSQGSGKLEQNRAQQMRWRDKRSFFRVRAPCATRYAARLQEGRSHPI
jgi:cytochrome c oxidase subunit 2